MTPFLIKEATTKGYPPTLKVSIKSEMNHHTTMGPETNVEINVFVKQPINVFTSFCVCSSQPIAAHRSKEAWILLVFID